ncbi:pyridoxamine 5'-phosphate oxidase family protein [Roseivirga sp.]|uniref:pyridoxamine 5'-phosphate oxidase family protein n=1 Tax=Roseivirga sp. TaxID=1964215 RepID=UPI003B51B867
MDLLLRSQLIGRLGCSNEGTTYVVPVSYVYDGQYIYGYTLEGKKMSILKTNPSVCFQVDSIADLANWQSVIVQGHFEELKGQDKEEALQLLANRFMPLKTGQSNLPKYGMDKIHSRVKTNTHFITYRIAVKEKSGRFEKEE